MNYDPLRTCPKCNEKYPATHFRLRNDPVSSCRACRRREMTRKNMKKKRALYKMLGVKGTTLVALKTAIDYRKAMAEAITLKERLKVLKKRFNYFTGLHRSRIKIMGFNPSPTAKTSYAIEVRKAVVAQYEAAYAKQIVIAEKGEMPKDITHYLD